LLPLGFLSVEVPIFIFLLTKAKSRAEKLSGKLTQDGKKRIKGILVEGGFPSSQINRALNETERIGREPLGDFKLTLFLVSLSLFLNVISIPMIFVYPKSSFTQLLIFTDVFLFTIAGLAFILLSLYLWVGIR